MGFQLSDTVDKDKVFLVKRSALEGRLDPAYNLALIKHKIYSFFPKSKIGRLCRSISGGTPSKANASFWVGKIPWVSPKDMRNFYLNDTRDHITEEAVKESSTNLIPKNSILLVVRSGILQHTIPVAITTTMMAINQDIKALIVNDDIIPPYLGYYIDIYQRKLLPLLVKHSTTVQSINTEQFVNLKIPVPPKKIQTQIVAQMDAAYAAKKTKEAEAQRLLDSIDDYLLQELAIELPEEGKNNIQERMFFRKFNEVSGGRFDPLFHSGGLYGFMGEVRYEMCKFRSVTHYMTSGFAAGKDEQSKDSNDIIQIWPTNITAEGQFVFARNVYIETAELKNHKNDLLEAGEILFNNTNSQEQVGKTVYFDKEENFFCSNHITRVKTVENLDAQYCTSLFNFYKKNKVFFKLCTNWNNQSGIGLDVLAQMYIPLPPLDKQQEIAAHIETIRNQAKQLRKQAAADLEKAKQEVEAMILGKEEQ